MKTFQKIALVSAIAAAPFAAQADLTPMDDALMGDTTGQAGVTIEIDIAGNGISVGEIEYTDTAGATDGDGGSVKLQNLVINNVNGLKQTIDVKKGGDLVIGMTPLTGLTLDLGGRDAKGVSKSAVLLQDSAVAGNQAEIVNNLNLTMNLGKTTQTVYNMSSKAAGVVEYIAAGDALTQVAFETGTATVDDGTGNARAATQADLDAGTAAFAAVSNTAGTLGGLGVVGGYENATSALAIGVDASFQITNLDVGLFGYTADQSTNVADKLAVGVAASDADSVGKVNEALAAYAKATGGTADEIAAGATLTTAQKGAVAASVADGSAIKINGLQFYGGTAASKTAVTMNQTIWAQGGSSDFGGGVYIQIGEIKGTLDIAGIEIGGASIGQVKVSNINLAGMTQRIYGH